MDKMGTKKETLKQKKYSWIYSWLFEDKEIKIKEFLLILGVCCLGLIVFGILIE